MWLVAVYDDNMRFHHVLCPNCGTLLAHHSVSHVQIMGRSLSPAFGIESLDSGKFALKVLSYTHQPMLEDPSSIQCVYLQRCVGQVINIWGNAVDVGWGEEEDESDDEFVL